MKAICLVLLGVLGSFASAQDIFGSEKIAYALMPSEVISSGVVTDVSISQSGKLILFRRAIVSDVVLKSSIKPGDWYCYNRMTKLTKRLGITRESMVMAMSDDQHLVFFGNQATDAAGVYSLANGSIMQLNLGKGYVAYAGDMPYAPFIMIGNRTEPAQLVTLDGKTTTVDFGPNVMPSFPVGSDDTNIYFHGSIAKSSPRKGLRLALNRSTGKVTQQPVTRDEEWHMMESYRPQPQHLLLSWNSSSATLSTNDSAVYPSSVIPKQVKIGPDSRNVQMAPNEEFVAYTDAGSLLIREIRSIDMVLAHKMGEAEALAELIARAKQVGTAFAILAADNDDVFPGQDGWESKLKPYTKNQDTSRDFNYTYKGGPATDIENPSQTEIGFFVAPGGRVVVYADTSVKFIPNP